MRYVPWVALVVVAVAALAPDAHASLRYFDTDQLEEGKSHTVSLLLQKGGSYMVVAAASEGGVDFDITVIGPDDEEVVRSASRDTNTDWVRFKVIAGGNFRIRISAVKGAGWYELCVLSTHGY